MTNKELVNFIIDSRRSGYSDSEIISVLQNYNWPKDLIQEGFLDIKNQKYKPTKIVTGTKVKTFVYLDKSLIKSLEKRAEKNLFTLPEQIEDILRRSVIGQKQKSTISDNIDDKFLSAFSRKKR